MNNDVMTRFIDNVRTRVEDWSNLTTFIDTLNIESDESRAVVYFEDSNPFTIDPRGKNSYFIINIALAFNAVDFTNHYSEVNAQQTAFNVAYKTMTEPIAPSTMAEMVAVDCTTVRANRLYTVEMKFRFVL